MLIFMVLVSLTIAILINVLTSCFVCYNVVIDTNQPFSTITTVVGVILVNAMVPFILGCITGLWYIG